MVLTTKSIEVEEFIYLFTRAILLGCLLVIAYLLVIPEKEITEESNIW